MVVFAGIALDFELQEAVGFGYVKDDDVLCIVLVFSGADFDLFEVTEVGVLGTAGQGYSGIEEVDELSVSRANALAVLQAMTIAFTG